MNFEEYAIAVARTKNDSMSVRELYSNWALGITGEAGEVADIVKKYLYHGKSLDLNHLEEEIGDTLYYLQALCNLVGLTFGDCTQKNADKLKKRYPNGFVEGGGKR